jgi:hypothetical protein
VKLCDRAGDKAGWLYLGHLGPAPSLSPVPHTFASTWGAIPHPNTSSFCAFVTQRLAAQCTAHSQAGERERKSPLTCDPPHHITCGTHELRGCSQQCVPHFFPPLNKLSQRSLLRPTIAPRAGGGVLMLGGRTHFQKSFATPKLNSNE